MKRLRFALARLLSACSICGATYSGGHCPNCGWFYGGDHRG